MLISSVCICACIFYVFLCLYLHTVKLDSIELIHLCELIWLCWTDVIFSKNTDKTYLLQISLTVERGIPETQDVETRGAMFQQLMSLADLQLDSYSSQLESVRRQPHLSDRYAQLKKKYEDERRKLIEPLCEFCSHSAVDLNGMTRLQEVVVMIWMMYQRAPKNNMCLRNLESDSWK